MSRSAEDCVAALFTVDIGLMSRGRELKKDCRALRLNGTNNRPPVIWNSFVGCHCIMASWRTNPVARFLGAFASMIRVPGGSGRPVAGVHADSPTNRVWDRSEERRGGEEGRSRGAAHPPTK